MVVPPERRRSSFVDVRRQEVEAPDGKRYSVMLLNRNEPVIPSGPFGVSALVNGINWVLAEMVFRVGWRVLVFDSTLNGGLDSGTKPVAWVEFPKKSSAALCADEMARALRTGGPGSLMAVLEGRGPTDGQAVERRRGDGNGE